MIDEIVVDADERMAKSAKALEIDLAKIRTGRAHPSLLDHIMVDYYGVPTPLAQAASISVVDPRMLAVEPWDKTMLKAIEKAIMESDLGLNPAVTSSGMRIPLPALSEERRRELSKQAKAETEHARVAVRNIRRDANNSLKHMVKDKEISLDEERRAMDQIQKFTDKHIAGIEEILSGKEKELMEI